MPSKPPAIKFPKIAPLPRPAPAPSVQPSMESQIFRNNRTADRVYPMVQQRYPKFMGRGF